MSRLARTLMPVAALAVVAVPVLLPLQPGDSGQVLAIPAPIGQRPPPPPAEMLRDPFRGDNNVPAHVYCVIFSPDGRYFLAGGDAGGRSPVRVYDAKSGKLITAFLPNENMGWTGGQFSPDSTKVVSWGTGSTNAYVWESATGKQLLKLEGHKQAVGQAVFAPDGKRIVTGGADRTLRVWDAATGKELLALQGHAADCGGCFSPDGKWIVSYSGDRTGRGWDAATGKEIWKQTQLAGHGITNRCFSPDGLVLCIGADASVRVVEVATGKAVAHVKSPAPVQGAAFIRDGKRLAWWANDKTLRIWDLPGGRVVRTVKLGDDLQHEPDNVTVSTDGATLLTGHTNQIVRIRDLATGVELHGFATVPNTGTRSLAVSPDARFAAAGSFRGWVYLWRLPDRRSLGDL